MKSLIHFHIRRDEAKERWYSPRNVFNMVYYAIGGLGVLFCFYGCVLFYKKILQHEPTTRPRRRRRRPRVRTNRRSTGFVLTCNPLSESWRQEIGHVDQVQLEPIDQIPSAGNLIAGDESTQVFVEAIDQIGTAANTPTAEEPDQVLMNDLPPSYAEATIRIVNEAGPPSYSSLT